MSKEKPNGPVSVTDDITPTTRQPIDQVDSTNWQEKPLTDLWDDRNTLETRLNYALQWGHPELIKQLQNGIARLDAVIQHRSNSNNEDRLV